MAFNFLTRLNADDIFISYTRRDAAKYAEGLRRELQKNGFSCFIDRLGTPPDADVPEPIKRKIRSCAMLVVVCTEWSGTRETIEKEIQEFLKTGRASSIVPVDFGGAVYNARWFKLIEGIAPEPETNPLDGDNPSESVVDRIQEAFKYTRRNERLRRTSIVTAAILIGLIMAGIAAGIYARWQLKAAQGARLQAADERARAGVARTEADAATSLANEQKRIAEEAGRDAAEKTKLAAEKTKLAAEATRQAQEAQAQATEARARAEYQSAIADSRSIANRSETLLRQRPLEVSSSLGLAKKALERLQGGTHLLETDTAVRDSLALFPRFHDRYVYAEGDSAEGDKPGFNDVSTVALSPEGDHFASIVENKVHVYASVRTGDKVGAGKSRAWTKVTEFDCACSEVALSGGATYAAVELDQGGVEIVNLKNMHRRTLTVVDANTAVKSINNIALSPGGRYLALTYSLGKAKGKHSRLLIVEVESEKVIKRFDEFLDTPGDKKADATIGSNVTKTDGEKVTTDQAEGPTSSSCNGLNMFIKDVTFGPTGDLAIAGEDRSQQGARADGRIIIWKLRLTTELEKAERKLTENDFANPEIIRQAAPVEAVAPGTDGNYFATETGVWKREVGHVEFEPVARLGYPVGVTRMSSISKVAFSRDGFQVTLVRNIEGTEQRDQSSDELVVEIWDANGYVDKWRAFQPHGIEDLVFKPGGELIAITPDQSSGAKPTRLYRVTDGTEAAPAFTREPANERIRYAGMDYVVYIDDTLAVVRDVWSGRRMTVNYGNEIEDIDAVEVSPGGRFLALSGKEKKDREHVILVYRTHGNVSPWGKPILDECRRLFLSADGRRLAGICDNVPRVWDVMSGRDVSPQSLDEDAITIDEPSVKLLSPDGRFLVITDMNHWPYLLDLSKAQPQLTRLLDDTSVTNLSFSRDGRYLGISGDDGTLYVFDMRSRDGVMEIAHLNHTGTITALAFSDDGRYVATGSSVSHAFTNERNHMVRVWLLRPNELLAEAKSRLELLRNAGW